MQSNLETISVICGRLSVGKWCIREDVRSGANTFPVSHRTSGRAHGLVLIESSGSPTLRVIVSSHDDYCPAGARQVPEAWEGLLVTVHFQDQISEQALLFVCLGNGYLV